MEEVLLQIIFSQLEVTTSYSFPFLFAGVEIEGPIGLNITTLSLSGVNLTELAEKLRNDTEVDMILDRTLSENGYITKYYTTKFYNFKIKF